MAIIDRLFVYGTLLRSAANRLHPLLESHCSYVGRARVRGALYDLGTFPGVVPSDDNADWVRGELYEMRSPVETLRRLDRYEGPLYRREIVEVLTEGHTASDAWVYLYTGSLDAAVRVPSGDYRDAGS